MRILIVSSCTGQKTVTDPQSLADADFARGPDHVRRREAALASKMLPAQDLYSGQQHVRLMRGIGAVAGQIQTRLYIVSAGYGLVPGDRKVAPYECTFTGRGRAELRSWADQLGIPAAFRALMGEPYDLCLLLLGDDYLAACGIAASLHLASPTIALCGGNTLRHLPVMERLKPVALGNPEAKRFSCGLVALKGEIAARLLARLAADPELLPRLLSPATDLLGLLDPTPPAALPRTRQARVHPDVDRVIELSDAWRNKPHRQRLRYFIPEWDDLVDPDYDFATDTHSGGSGDWSNEVYAHQMYPEPNYDGILVSTVVAEKSKKKKERINRLGVHRFLRVPRDFPVMGDCGAFGYIAATDPPYTTPEILDYYTRLDFDYGVSIDHLIVSSNRDEWKHRYQLTIDNAANFIREHRQQGLGWTPIGGWDWQNYIFCHRETHEEMKNDVQAKQEMDADLPESSGTIG